VRGVQPGDVGAQLADLGDQGLGLSHRTSISALTPMSTTPGRAVSKTGVLECYQRRRFLLWLEHS
jgi:hypothetical protein